MNSPVIYFDNVCVLCSWSVQYIHRHDKKKYFYFASVDSEEFKTIAGLFPKQKAIPDSVILYYKGKVYTRSGAALRIAWRLRFPLPLLSVGFIIPPFIRNGIYDMIAMNRYRWFGKREACFIPQADLKSRFLD